MDNKLIPTDSEKWIDQLSKLSIAAGPLIARKEIAAWTAAALYITILLAFLKFLSEHPGDKFLLILGGVAIVFLFFGFIYFVFLQFGKINYRSAQIHVLNKWIFKLLNGEKLPTCRKCCEIRKGKQIPEFLLKEIDKRNDEIRQLSMWKRVLFFPTLKDSNDYEMSEREEAALYGILLLMTL